MLWSYDIDIFKHVIDAFAGTDAGTESSSNIIGRIMTGFLVAGGSGAIFNIFTKLGLRSPGKLAQKAQGARVEAAGPPAAGG